LRSIRVLVPGTTGRFRCGGLLVELQTARLLAQIARVEVVTYRQREAGLPFLADLLRAEPLGAAAADQALWRDWHRFISYRVFVHEQTRNAR
jgi:hypothetical protein